MNQLPYSASYYTISNRDGHQLDDDIRVKATMIFSDTPSRKTYNEYLELCKELKELDGRVSEMEIKGIPIIRYDAHSKSKTNAKSNSYMMDDKICQITKDGSYVYIYGRTPLINRQSIIDYHLFTERLYSYGDELLGKIEAGEKKRRHDFESYIDTHILNYIRENYKKRYLFSVPENGNSMISQIVHEELIKKYSPIVECNLIGIQASLSDLYDYNNSFDQLTADIIIAVVNKNKKKKILILKYRYGRVDFLREDSNN